MGEFRVQRSIEIDANPERVFETVADFSTWKTWSPWLCAEPDAQVTVSADSSSVGSTYAWRGEVVGEGEMEHKEFDRPYRIVEELCFIKPFRSRSRVEFELERAGNGTRLTWQMIGSLPWFLFWMRPSIQTFVGMDYERGLKMLKEWIETGDILSTTTIRGIEPVGPLRMAGIRGSCTLQEIGPLMESSLLEARQKVEAHNVPLGAEVMSVYHDLNPRTQEIDFTVGFVLCDTADVPSDMSEWSIPEVNALAVEHIGSYDHLGNAWGAAHQYARYRKLKQSKAGAFEIYRNDPHETAPADLKTEVFLPLK